jgi:serine/threonine-protein kinase
MVLSRLNPRALKPSEILAGRYEVIRAIGHGGMGTVYLARQLGLHRKVAIKTLRPDTLGDADGVARLRREAHVIRRLTHPNTVRIYEFGESDDGVWFIAMEYLDGLTLDRALRERGALPQDLVIAIAQQVLRSLAEAHAHGIVHRDIKPNNIMLCRQIGANNLVKVLDFGLARLQDGLQFTTLTGRPMGTPTYMSPEQLFGRDVDARSDLYSLGLTLFELATGKAAYTGRTAYHVAMQHISPEPLAIPSPLRGTRLGLCIQLATQKEISARYASAADMLEDLTGDQIERGLAVTDVSGQYDTPEAHVLAPRSREHVEQLLSRRNESDVHIVVEALPPGAVTIPLDPIELEMVSARDGAGHAALPHLPIIDPAIANPADLDAIPFLDSQEVRVVAEVISDVSPLVEDISEPSYR